MEEHILNEVETIRKYLDEYVEQGLLKYSYIEKVKIRNRITRNQDLIRDIFMLSVGNNSMKPGFLVGIKKNRTSKIYISHYDLTHWNMQNSTNSHTLSNGDVIYYRSFCNPVLQDHIWKNSDTASKILKGNLMEGNPNDRYRDPNSVDIDQYCPAFHNVMGMVKNKCKLKDIFINDWDGTLRNEAILNYQQTRGMLTSDHDKVYAYCTPANEFSDNWQWRIIKQDDIGKLWRLSNYYKPFSYRNVEDDEEIPTVEVDVACCGCGSAGANIMEQIARLNYFTKQFVLVDFDKVEEKNLRNQPYTNQNIASSKVSALKVIIQRSLPRSRTLDVNTFNQKFQDVFWGVYDNKYIISGFDSIDCRLELFDKILKGEIKAKYLIDARYLDLDCSLFFIDTSNEDEMKYYHKLLLEDKTEFDKLPKPEPKVSTQWTLDDVRKWGGYDGNECLHSTCNQCATMLGIGGNGTICERTTGRNEMSCGCATCLNLIKEQLELHNVPNPYSPQEESSCISENLIHIYKLVSSWVVSNIRSIETDDKKIFTHVDITTEPLPNAMILRK